MLNTGESLIQALEHPARAGFKIAYEIFASSDRKKLAHLPNEIRRYEQMPARSFFLRDTPDKTDSDAEREKSDILEGLRLSAPKPARMLRRLEEHKARYDALKTYFENKIRELGLQDPLIFFDDNALRIDIGYGPKEFDALFHDFTQWGGIFQTQLLPYINIIGKSPDAYLQDELCQDYQESLKKESDGLITRFDAISAHVRAIRDIPDQSLSDEPSMIRHLTRGQGFVIGEVHEHSSPKQFLIDNMALFKSQGVSTIYMEHLLHERHQALLDSYFGSGHDAPMPRELEIYLNHLDSERSLKPPSTFTEIVKTAKKHDIKIVAIDSEATYEIGKIRGMNNFYNSQAPINRYKAMNMSLLEYVQADAHDDNHKFIAFVGNAHVTTFHGVQGVSDLLNCPNIFIRDVMEAEPEKVEKHAQYHVGNTTIHFDILYHRSPAPHESLVNPISAINPLTHSDRDCSSEQQILAALRDKPIDPSTSLDHNSSHEINGSGNDLHGDQKIPVELKEIQYAKKKIEKLQLRCNLPGTSEETKAAINAICEALGECIAPNVANRAELFKANKAVLDHNLPILEKTSDITTRNNTIATIMAVATGIGMLAFLYNYYHKGDAFLFFSGDKQDAQEAKNAVAATITSKPSSQ